MYVNVCVYICVWYVHVIVIIMQANIYRAIVLYHSQGDSSFVYCLFKSKHVGTLWRQARKKEEENNTQFEISLSYTALDSPSLLHLWLSPAIFIYISSYLT